MTRACSIQVVLQGQQPFRFQWKDIEVLPGQERHLVVDRAMLDRLDAADIARGFVEVHPVDRLDATSASTVLDRVVALGCRVGAVATNDEYMLGECALLQQRYGLAGPRPSEVAVFTDKLAMKELVLGAGLRAPVGMALSPDEAAADPEALADRVAALCGLPVVLKPRSSANSLDVFVVRTADELLERCAALRRPDFMAEAFVAGRVLFCDSICSAATGTRTTLMTAAYAQPPLGYRSGSCHGSRTMDAGPLASKVQMFTEQALDALPTMADRVTHLEVIEQDGELWFLEVAARAPGAEVARCGELHIGINLEELNFRLQLGLPWSVASPRGQVAWMWFPKRDGTVLERTPPALTSPATLTWQVDIGERVCGAEHSPNNRREDAALIVVAGPTDSTTLEADFARLAASDPVLYGDLDAAMARTGLVQQQ